MRNMQGVIGAYSKENVTLKGLYILYGVQHRGQESAGISAASDRSLRTWKGKGLVSNVFDERSLALGDIDYMFYPARVRAPKKPL